jgi:hypothetical protein
MHFKFRDKVLNHLPTEQVNLYFKGTLCFIFPTLDWPSMYFTMFNSEHVRYLSCEESNTECEIICHKSRKM